MSSKRSQRNRESDSWILTQRETLGKSARQSLDPLLPYAYLIEDERSLSGRIISVATVFLTNRECPWRCLMCDLWRHTLTESLKPGAIPAQIDYALARLAQAQQIKLYNNGSFFDHQAILPQDYPAIAARLKGFEQVIVESHPALINEDCWRFRDLISGRLEVAMGLETVHPTVLPRLNKKMTPDQFAAAAERLRQNDVALRAFILVKPPFLNEEEALFWAKRSVDFAFACQASVVVLIPTRPGNGALEALAKSGDYVPPKLLTLEKAAAYGIELKRGRVFADLWDLQQFATCPICFRARQARLLSMNLRQEVCAPIVCEACNE